MADYSIWKSITVLITRMCVFVSSMMDATPLTATAPMPGCTMKIFYGDPSLHEVAENVKIGDPLTLVISIDKQDVYGLRISDCLVRDGLGWGEQRLIDEEGWVSKSSTSSYSLLCSCQDSSECTVLSDFLKPLLKANVITLKNWSGQL